MNQLPMSQRDRFLAPIKNKHPNTIYIGIHGSRMFGTYTPQSDYDLYTVYVPSFYEVIFRKNNIKSGDCQNGELDEHHRSLISIINGLRKGDIFSLEYLYSDPKWWVEVTPLWKEIISVRENALAKNMSSTLNYLEAQVSDLKTFNNNGYYAPRSSGYFRNFLNNAFHVKRVIYQLDELIETKTIHYPLKKSSALYDVKYNEKLSADNISSVISVEYVNVLNKLAKSNLPENPNIKPFIDILENYYLINKGNNHYAESDLHLGTDE